MKASEYRNIFENEQFHWWYEGMKVIAVGLLEKYLPRKRELKILDAGCGTGGMMKVLSKYGTVFGIDNSPRAISLCQKQGIKRAIVGSVNNLSFPKNSFDLVTSFDVLCSQGIDVPVAIGEFARVLKPAGQVLIRVPAFEFFRGGHDVVVHSVHRFSKNEIEDLLNEQGFRIVFFSYANFFLSPFVLAKRWITRNATRPQSDVMTTNKALNLILKQFLVVEGKIMKNLSLPFGVSAIVIGEKI